MNFYKVILFFLLLNVSNLYGQEVATNYSSTQQSIDSTFFKLKDELTSAIEQQNDSLTTIKHIEFANFYNNSGAVNEAILNYQKASDLLQHTDDTLKVYVKLQIGSINFFIKQFEIAKQAYLEALQDSRAMDYTRGEAMAQSALGSCFEKQGDFKQALVHQQKSLTLFERLNDYLGLALVNENIGSIYEDQFEFEKAYQAFQQALTYVEKTNDVDRKINILNNLGDANRKAGKYVDALPYTEQAVKIALETSNSHQLESAYKDLSKNYAFLKDYEKAYGALVLSDSIHEEILELQNTRQVNALQALYDAKNKQSKIDLLLKENQVKSAHESMLLLALVGLVLCAIGAYLYLKKRKESAIKLQHYKQQVLKADLEKKQLIEENLQREIELKTTSLSKYSLHLAHKNKMLADVAHTLKNLKGRKQMDVHSKLTSVVELINDDLSEKQEWEEFMGYFGQIHPSFFKNLESKTLEELSSSEMRLCMLLKLNLSSKEIASILRITPDSIRIARYRLRKKLAINSGEKLTSFLHQL
ncbi:tetratricopeptide repeat protein [Joostella sp. CR20]|uniref:tetratricopeptide repeat protein n=1 Tax=Joostella sp. CR20 TaxID=2804312 RepID=UPI00313BBDB9